MKQLNSLHSRLGPSFRLYLCSTMSLAIFFILIWNRAMRVLWNSLLSNLLHLIIVWSCGHYYKVPGWTHVGHMVNTMLHTHVFHFTYCALLHNASWLLHVAVQCLTYNTCRTFQNYLHKDSMECLTDNTCSLFSIYSLSSSILVL